MTRHLVTAARGSSSRSQPQAPLAAASPSGESDRTSDDDDDAFDLDDALAMLADAQAAGGAADAVAARVGHAISAVYDAMTREEAAEARKAGEAGVSEAAAAAVVVEEAMDPAALKRARRTEIEKKSRQRRQNLLRRMRDDVRRLECVYADLVERKVASSEIDALARPSRRPRSTSDLKQMYSRLSALAQALNDERSHMKKLLQEHEAFHEAISEIRKSEVPATADAHGLPLSKSFSAGFQFLSPADCYAIIRDCHEAIIRFEKSEDFESTGASFMGWKDRRKFDEVTSALHYGFAKKYPHESARGLFLKTWEMFCDDAKFAQLSFDASVKMRFVVLQTLGDNIFIVRRDYQYNHMPGTFLTVNILFRLETAEGFTLCFRSIPAPEIQKSLEPHEIWFDVFHWTHFNHTFDDNGVPTGCEVVTGGSIEDPTLLAARHWLLELIISVLRWESTCVSPLFIKL